MGSPGIDIWIAKAPESWAKLVKKSSKKKSFEQFKKEFFVGAEKENKSYLKDYLTDEHLKYIYTQGYGGEKIEHPEHRQAISLAQKNKWQIYKKALAYCKNAGIDLDY